LPVPATASKSSSSITAFLLDRSPAIARDSSLAMEDGALGWAWKWIPPELEEVVDIMYPNTEAPVIADFLGVPVTAVRQYVKTHGLHKGRNRHPIGYTRQYHGTTLMVKVNDDHPQQHRRFAPVHLLSWEQSRGRKVPKDHVVINIDGDYLNTAPDNLHCIPQRDLLNWARFVQQPVEVHVFKLTNLIMALDTSDKVKQKLLEILDQIVDPDKKPDLVRQRAACETVATLVGLLRVEVSYLHAIEGDGVIPFLEGARQEMSKRREESRKKRRHPLLGGPAGDHPWRDLGDRKAS
jgi:hypothetical protein